MKFSIIIPLESHRGQTRRCIEGWACGQTHPREDYQLVIAVPSNHGGHDLDTTRALLAPHDRIECFCCIHDMSLVAAAANKADGEIFLFTEAHAIPEPETLERANRILLDHPEWSGFSFRSVPITHNMLSEIEAGMYAADIEHNMLHHPWLKVLDQCLVVTRQAYESVGGIEAEYGHFAEWLFAARMFQAGRIIGYDAGPAIHHYYIGQVAELEAFTLDFGQGEIRFAASTQDDPCQKLFHEIPEWTERRQWGRAEAWEMARLRMRTSTADAARASGASIWCLCRDAAGWALQAAVGIRGGYWLALLASKRQRWILLRALKDGDRDRARQAFLRWIRCLIHQARTAFLYRNSELLRRVRGPREVNAVGAAGSFGAERGQDLLGFHRLETDGGVSFRWSSQCAAAFVPLVKGEHQVEIEWREVRSLDADNRDTLCFYVNGCRLPPSSVIVNRCRAAIQVNSRAAGECMLSWTIRPFPATNDRRILGLPIYRVAWKSTNCTAGKLPTRNSAIPGDAVYFLHVQKCAGTTMRHLFENGFAAARMMAPYHQIYYVQQLHDYAPLHQQSFSFYEGHFGWALPAALPHRKWKIFTVLREPLDRLLSLFYYRKEQGRLPSTITLDAWVDNTLCAQDLMTAYFVPEMNDLTAPGYELARARANDLLPRAIENLKKCTAVGLAEAIDDTTQLFAWHTGILPPQHTARHNPTRDRIAPDEVPRPLRARIEILLEADFALYEKGRELFRTALARLHAVVAAELGKPVDTDTLCNHLRAQSRRRHAKTMSGALLGDSVTWTPDDAFRGENLHSREEHNAERLRWTGPGKVTRFQLYLGAARTWSLVVQLHRATPPAHVEAAELSVNGVPLTLERATGADGSFLVKSRLERSVAALAADGIATFELQTPVIRGEEEFRMLGVAIKSLTLRAV